MENPRILFWYRKDLRVNNNSALDKSLSISKSITSIYIFDKDYNYDFNAQSKAWFLGLSLKELKLNWEKVGSRLIIDEGNPIILIPKIAKLIDAKFVAWNKAIEPYEIRRDLSIKKKLEKLNIEIINLWDHLLIEPSKIYTGSNNPYTVYGPFYKNFRNQINEICFTKYDNNFFNCKLNDINKDIRVKFSKGKLDLFIKKNNFNGKSICPCIPGEKAALKLLNDFLENKIFKYELMRDFPSSLGTSYLSASIRFGTISIKTIWEKTLEAAFIKTDHKDLLSIETWQKELAWREFYQHCLYHFPELESGPYRKKWNNFPWQNNQEWFDRWSQGETGVPIIDAAMRQLNKSGWMHNRCRMIVASFLVKDLICNWQMGEKKFMETLVDGDLAANNGGWQWSASSGMDPKPLRIFNPFTQTKKFDPLCQYIKFWIPELAKVNNKNLISGELSNIERKNYPSPIIEHNQQQRIFKTIYAEI